MKATLENVVFVNFHKTIVSKKITIPEFGKEDLFNAIKNYFMKTSDYKSSCEELTQEKINENAEKLKLRAQDAVLSNKIFGGIVGAFPGVDWIIQRFVIKKNALKNIAQIYGYELKIIDEKEINNEIESGKNEDQKSENLITEKPLHNESKNEKIINEDTLIEDNNQTIMTGDIDLYPRKDDSVVLEEVSNVEEAPAANQNKIEGNEIYSAIRTGLEIVGRGLHMIGAVTGMIMGAYFMNDYCEKLIDKFTEYYKKNANNCTLSYKEAIEYFEVTKK